MSFLANLGRSLTNATGAIAGTISTGATILEQYGTERQRINELSSDQVASTKAVSRINSAVESALESEVSLQKCINKSEEAQTAYASLQAKLAKMSE